MDFSYRKIATIRSPYRSKFGIPRQSGRITDAISTVVFAPEYRSADWIRGIEQFSHLWLLFDFSESHRDTVSATVRPPRLGGNKRIGVFASRSPFRPNPVGLSCVKLEKVEYDTPDGPCLLVSGADILDGTPVIDIKPYIAPADSHPDASSGFASDRWDHSLAVTVRSGASEGVPDDIMSLAKEMIADDPRPGYISDEKEFTMTLSHYDITFVCSDGNAEITEIKDLEKQR